MKVSIILAGGKGSRLWPLSRETYPKQFCSIFDESLFSMAVRRALIFSKPEDIYISTNKSHEYLVKRDLERMGVEIPEENIVLEPEMKGTFPAIYYTAMRIRKRKRNCPIAVLPADHYIDVNENYRKAFEEAFKVAERHIVTFGIVPRKPHTGYGYIKPGKKLKGFENAFAVERFVEKPDEEAARRYVNEGYLWNSGMFVFTLKILEEESREHQPELVEMLEKERDEAYKFLPEVSFDRGIMEKTTKAVVIRLDTIWSDLGSFDSLYEIFEKDEDGNAAVGDVISISSKNNLIYSDSSRLIATLDVEDLVIVETRDASLICRRGSSEKIREIVEVLEAKSDERAKIPLTVYRPWGSFTVIGEGEGYKIKKIVVYPKKRLSLQRHHRRSEHWIIHRGVAKVRIGESEKILQPGEHAFIPVGEVHRLENPGDENLEVIEVQLGDYLGEDDIERLEDDFGRV